MGSKNFFVHDTAIVESNQIGDKSRIWAFCNVQKGVVLGNNCNVCDHCFIESNVTVGNNVTIKNGVSLWDGVTVEDDVFIGPNAVFTNDIKPRSKVYHQELDKTLIRQGATIGAGAVIVAGHTIGRYAFIGAGAVVTKDVPDFTIWYGNPAIQQGYICKCSEKLEFRLEDTKNTQGVCACGCGGEYELIDGVVICKS